jgi:hypothetical protein
VEAPIELTERLGSLFVSLGSPNDWRWTLATGVFLALPLVFIRSLMTESPLWQGQGRRSPETFREIVRHFQQPSVRQRLAVAQLSYFLYQVTDQGLGMYLPLILTALLGVSEGTSAWSSVVVKAVTIPAPLMTVWLIERWGRRPLQIWGFLGRALTLLTLGGLLWVLPQLPLMVVAGLMGLAYVFGAAGPDKTVVIAPAEQFATTVRGTGEGLSEMAGRIGGMVGIAGYGFLYALWGSAAGLLFFGAACALGTIVSLALQETRSAPIDDVSPVSSRV